jgi:choline kinase
METTIKTVHKLLDKLILPKYDDIMEYHLESLNDDTVIKIVFWMDGTEQEVEEEIVNECRTILSLIGNTNYKFRISFTTEGEHFYTYT